MCVYLPVPITTKPNQKETMHPTPDPCKIIIANVRAANPDLSGAELRVKLREAHAEYVRWILDTSK